MKYSADWHSPGFPLLAPGTFQSRALAWPVLLVLLAACGMVSEPPPDPHAAFADEIPGYGGHFIDTDGAPVVFLTDPRERATALRVLAPSLRARGFDPRRLRAVRGVYEHRKLFEWFVLARDVAAQEGGVAFVDLDEAHQRIHVGVDGPAEDRVAIERRLLGRGVPRAALAVESAASFSQFAGLNDTFRPVVGGLRLGTDRGACTLGFNAAGGLRTFLTNSHCTQVQGGEEGSRFGQATTGEKIGAESSDPDYVRAGYCPCEWRVLVCLRRARCRYSDSARIAYLPGVEPALGAIARTEVRSRESGSREIEGAFRIAAERSDPIAGETLHKVGATTGWTFGEVSKTCFDAGNSDNDLVLVCQSTVRAGATFGDSGSPVIAPTDSTRGEVALYGILWGGNSDEYVFSPMSGIERDLGQLVTIAPEDPQHGTLADLIVIPSSSFPGPTKFCRRNDAGELVVRIANQGARDVLTTSTTSVRFFPGGRVERSTPPMPASGGVIVTFTIPTSCMENDCGFQITLDANGDVAEGDGVEAPGEVNNVQEGLCIS